MATKVHNLSEINSLSRKGFVRVIGPVFEKSPWIAEAAAARRPFATVEQLHQALCSVVREATAKKKTALIQAHPELGERLKLTAESTREQASAGLDQLSRRETILFRQRNEQYHKKFGFPFVICARLNHKKAILDALAVRLGNSRPAEIETALGEIFKIAELRLRDLLAGAQGALTTHVLDTASGRPAAGMKIELWRGGKRLREVKTNTGGRCDTPLLCGDDMRAGNYELLFFVGDYFGGDERFLDKVPVSFAITNTSQSYHIPLLCSPWSYTTYRGS